MTDRGPIWLGNMQTARPGWQFYLLAAVGAAVTIGLLIVAASLALILLPVVIVLVILLRFLAKRQIRRAYEAQKEREAQAQTPVIEGDYRVVEEEDQRRNR